MRSCELPNLLFHRTTLRIKLRVTPLTLARGEGFATHACHHAARCVVLANITSLFTFHFAKQNDPELVEGYMHMFAPFDSLRSLRIILLRKISIVSVVLSLRFVFGIKA